MLTRSDIARLLPSGHLSIALPVVPRCEGEHFSPTVHPTPEDSRGGSGCAWISAPVWLRARHDVSARTAFGTPGWSRRIPPRARRALPVAPRTFILVRRADMRRRMERSEARRASVDVDAVPLSAFGLEDDCGPLVSERHAHEKHQLLYAAAGTLKLEAEDGQWLLPPQRAAWIRAGVSHRVRALGRVALRTVYLAPPVAFGPESACV